VAYSGFRRSGSGSLIHLYMLSCGVLYRVSPRVLPMRVFIWHVDLGKKNAYNLHDLWHDSLPYTGAFCRQWSKESPMRARACLPLHPRTLVFRYQGEVSFVIAPHGSSKLWDRHSGLLRTIPIHRSSSVIWSPISTLARSPELSLLSTPTRDDDWIALS
jgi:hypothetical protein